MKAQPMFENVNKALKSLDKDKLMLMEVAAMIGSFLGGGISESEFEQMSQSERSFLAGAIAGNFAAHHPKEAYDWLQYMNRRND